MRKLVTLSFILLTISLISSCDKQTRMQNSLKGKTWDATVTNTFDGVSSIQTGTFVFEKNEFYYVSTLTDASGNTITSNNSWSAFEDLEITLSDTSGSVKYNVDINDKKHKEWNYSETVSTFSVTSKIVLTR